MLTPLHECAENTAFFGFGFIMWCGVINIQLLQVCNEPTVYYKSTPALTSMSAGVLRIYCAPANVCVTDCTLHF